MAKKIKLGVCGLGYIGRRHAELAAGLPGFELAGAADPDPAAAARLAPEWNAECYPTLEELLRETRPEAVAVCTPNGLHMAHAAQALESGAHVVCEKPLGLRAAECREVVALARARGLKLFCVLQNRYSPSARWLRELLDRNRLGRVFQVDVNCYWNRGARYYEESPWKGSRDLDGGPLYTQFSHFLDVFCWLFGKPEASRAEFANFAHRHNTEFEDTGAITFRLPGGALGSVRYTTAAFGGNMESSISILGERGAVKVGGQYMERAEYCRVENYAPEPLPPANPPNDYGGWQGSAGNHLYVYEHVAQALRAGAAPWPSAEEALLTVEWIEDIYKQRDI